MSRSGYTLPVFAVAAAQAALLHLTAATIDSIVIERVELDLLDDSGHAEIAVQQVAKLDDRTALAITLSDPGDNLDLTRNTPIWAKVAIEVRPENALEPDKGDALILEAGEGLGRSLTGEPAIYSYARRLFAANLEPLLRPEQRARITIILPQGRALAERTSNAAFGIVEGLSLLGTSGISKPLSAEAHFVEYQQALREKAQRSKLLTFCLGSNGLRVADRLGLEPATIVQTGNWVGALLVEAGLQGVQEVHLLGYQGKLIKLAGGIFNTSSHLADAKLEILAASVIQVGGDRAIAQAILEAPTADAAYQQLMMTEWGQPVFDRLVQQIRQKAQRYVQKYANVEISVPVTLFDRQGQIIATTRLPKR